MRRRKSRRDRPACRSRLRDSRAAAPAGLPASVSIVAASTTRERRSDFRRATSPSRAAPQLPALRGHGSFLERALEMRDRRGISAAHAHLFRRARVLGRRSRIRCLGGFRRRAPRARRRAVRDSCSPPRGPRRSRERAMVEEAWRALRSRQRERRAYCAAARTSFVIVGRFAARATADGAGCGRRLRAPHPAATFARPAGRRCRNERASSSSDAPVRHTASAATIARSDHSSVCERSSRARSRSRGGCSRLLGVDDQPEIAPR